MKRDRILAAGLWLAIAVAGAAADGGGEPVSMASPDEVIGDLLERALNDAPRIAVHEERVTGADESAKAADRLPQPKIRAEYSPIPLETRGGPRNGAVTLSQSFPAFGKRGLASDAAYHGVARIRGARDGAVAGLLHSIKKSVWEIYRIDRAVEITEEERDLLAEVVQVVEAKYSTGSGSQANLFQAQLLVTRAENSLLMLRGTRVEQIDRIAGLIGGAAEVPPLAELPEPLLDVDSAAVYRLVLEESPAVISADESVSESEARLSLARKGFAPDFGIFAGWTQIGRPDYGMASSDPGRDSWSLGAEFTLPLNRGPIKEEIRAAEARVRATEMQRAEEVESVSASVRGSLARLSAAESSIELHRSALIPQSESAFESAMAAYSAGEIEFSDLVLAERMLLDARLGYHEMVAHYRTLVSAVERDMGTVSPEPRFIKDMK